MTINLNVPDLVWAVLQIHIDLNTGPDPDPAFEVNSDPDPAPDSDPGFFYEQI